MYYLPQDISKIDYDDSILTSDLACIYLVQKYKNNCLASQLSLPSPLNDYLIFGSRAIGNAFELAANDLMKCIRSTEKLFVLPIGIMFFHSNLLIYRKHENVIEHFDPYGKEIDSIELQDNIQKLIKRINELNETEHVFDTPLTYVSPTDTCPNGLGPQSMESKIPPTGNEGIDERLCLIWSIFIAELVLENPDLTTKEIMNEVYDYSYGRLKTQIYNENRKIWVGEILNLGHVLRRIIIGYLVHLQTNLDEYVKIVFLNSKYKHIKTVSQFSQLINVHYVNEGSEEAMATAMENRKELLRIFFQFSNKNKDIKDLIIDIPINVNKEQDAEKYKIALDKTIEDSQAALKQLMPIYNELLEELETQTLEEVKPQILTPKQKKTVFSRILSRITGHKKGDNTKTIDKIGDKKYDELLALHQKIAAYKYSIQLNNKLLKTIETNMQPIKAVRKSKKPTKTAKGGKKTKMYTRKNKK